MDNKASESVLFVCMGNICRSPTAEAVFRRIVDDAGIAARFEIDSAGTHAYHTNEPADRRATAAAARRGYAMDDIRARRIQDPDFDRFDYIIAIDRGNQAILLDLAESQHHDKIRLFLEFSSGQEDEVPDPYYGGAGDIEFSPTLPDWKLFMPATSGQHHPPLRPEAPKPAMSRSITVI